MFDPGWLRSLQIGCHVPLYPGSVTGGNRNNDADPGTGISKWGRHSDYNCSGHLICYCLFDNDLSLILR